MNSTWEPPEERMWGFACCHGVCEVSIKPGKMARRHSGVLLAVAALGLLIVQSAVNGEIQQEEEERSCQGAFDLYFVLDKWVSPYYLWLCSFLVVAHCHATAQLFGNAERISQNIHLFNNPEKYNATVHDRVNNDLKQSAFISNLHSSCKCKGLISVE